MSSICFTTVTCSKNVLIIFLRHPHFLLPRGVEVATVLSIYVARLVLKAPEYQSMTLISLSFLEQCWVGLCYSSPIAAEALNLLSLKPLDLNLELAS